MFAATALALLTCSSAAGSLPGGGSTGQQGLTLKTYTNMALAGQPATATIVGATACSLPGAAPLSAELVGTIAFPEAGGLFYFDCAWSGTTLGFVWIDGHLVCQDGNAYQPSDGTTDNPLPVNTVASTKGVVASLPFRAHIYSAGSAHNVGVNVTWSVENEDQMPAALSHVAIPAAALAPNLPAAEQQRDDLQRGLATGWGSWLHGNMLPVVKLPEAAVLRRPYARSPPASASTAACPTVPDRTPRARPMASRHVWGCIRSPDPTCSFTLAVAPVPTTRQISRSSTQPLQVASSRCCSRLRTASVAATVRIGGCRCVRGTLG